MKLKTIAIDDEPLALQLVSEYINKAPYLELVGSFDNPLDAIDFLSENPADLIILDIQMPDLSGTEFARTLGNSHKIIFTTAYEKYALEGFKLNAVDYLLKPFSFEEFLKAANKAHKLEELESNVNTDDRFLFLKSEHKIKRINFNDIIFIESLKDYIKVHTIDESIQSINTIKSIELKLSNEFMRVHRSFIVNLKKVGTIEKGKIIFGKNIIPISDQYKETFQEYLNKNVI